MCVKHATYQDNVKVGKLLEIGLKFDSQADKLNLNYADVKF